MDTAQQVLKEVFGHPAFRPDQRKLIDAVLCGRDVLGVMPTGAGKSLCYQVPALLLDGLTLVISPLISLMKDQVNALEQAGVAAAFLNSTQSMQEQQQTLARAADGGLRLLYVAPERLAAAPFQRVMERRPPVLVTVDEAHCISQWGQDFRPGYLKVAEFLESLPIRPPVCALTATATQPVQQDILRLLHLSSAYTLVSGFDRPNLYFAVERPQRKQDALLSLLRARAGQSGIIYCSTRKSVDDVFAALCSHGLAAARYHAGLSQEERRENQDDFLFDRKNILVATNAFGMGIDKSNVSFVIHYNMPQNLESYYQEAGRAGRDGEPADCILLYSGQDVRTCQFLIEHSREADGELDETEREEILVRDRERLRQMTYYCTTSDCLRAFLLRYFGADAPSRCGHCSSCQTEFHTEDATVEAQKLISCVYRLRQRGRCVGKSTIAEIVHGAKNEKILRAGYDTLSTYGLLSTLPIRRIRYLLDRLLEEGYLSCTGGEYPVVQLSARSDEILRKRLPFSVQIPQNLPVKEPVLQRSSSVPDEALFDKLRDLRARFAATAHVPAYVVFSNATLHALCVRLPSTPDELLEVPGVGRAKCERYGTAFLACIQEHLSETAAPVP